MKKLLFVFLGAALLAAAVYADEPVCFDKQQVFDAARRLDLEKGWTGDETNLDQVESALTLPEKTLTLFLKPDGTAWSLWTFKGEEGCLMSKGVNWKSHPLGRPSLRRNE